MPTLSAAQSWPEPPQVAGAFTAAQLEAAAKLEPGPVCLPTRQPIECTDPDLQSYQQRLHEAIAAAFDRMPDAEGRRDIAPSSLLLFGGRMASCRSDAVRACVNNPAGLREMYPAIANLPDLAVDACTPLAEKACKISNLSERIAEWNARNTEADAAPVVALHDPGFDCTCSMISIALKTVCGDADLSALHRAMVNQIRTLRESGDMRQIPHEKSEVLSDAYWHRETLCNLAIDGTCWRPIHLA